LWKRLRFSKNCNARRRRRRKEEEEKKEKKKAYRIDQSQFMKDRTERPEFLM